MLSPKVTWLGVADTAGSFVSRTVEQLELTFEGLASDRHAGLTMKAGVRQKHYPPGTEIRNFRQLSLLSKEELAVIAQQLNLPLIDASWLGGNLLLEGIADLTQLPSGTRLQFPSGAVIAIDADNLPCRGPGRILQRCFPEEPQLDTRFVKAALNRRGLVGWVECPGVVKQGDEVRVLLRRDLG